MKVELEKTFPMPAPPEAAWALLQDVAAVAGCMPGAAITERVDDTHYKGTVSVRMGPAMMAFRGEIEVRERDAGSKMIHLTGKGSDTGGSSGASMDLVARIEPADEGSQLHGRSEVAVSGKAASFGGRMMSTIAGQILGQFAANFAAELKARAADTPGAVSAAAVASQAATLQRAPAVEAALSSEMAGGNNGCAQLPPAVGRESIPPAVTLARAGGELSALGLLWSATREWLREIFRHRPV